MLYDLPAGPDVRSDGGREFSGSPKAKPPPAKVGGLLMSGAESKRRYQHILRLASAGRSMLCGVRLDTWLYAISVAWTAIVFATLIYIVFA